MTKNLTLPEYRSLTYSLRKIKPLGVCCGNALLAIVHVEPLAGRKKTQVQQTCIIQCPVCKKMYIST
jgi:hypothetical protein